MTDIEKKLKKLSFSAQQLEIGHNILKFLNLQNVVPEQGQYFNSVSQTIDGQHFISALTMLISKFPSEQLASTFFTEHTPLTAHGPFGLLLLTSATFGDALQYMVDYLGQIMPIVQFNKIDVGDQTHLVLTHLYDLEELNSFFTEILFFSSLKNKIFLQAPISPIAIHFIHAPLANLDVYQQALNENMLFNQIQNKIIFSRKDLNTPILTADAATHAWIKSQLEQEIRLLDNHKTLTVQVKRYIQHAMKNHLVIDNQSIADALLMSSRTLSRKLKEENNNISQLKLEVGIEYAKLLLIESKKSITDIAAQVGFNNVASFTRTFKRITAQTPTQYRNQN